MIRNQNPRLRIRDIERIQDETFASWFANQVSLSSTKNIRNCIGQFIISYYYACLTGSKYGFCE